MKKLFNARSPFWQLLIYGIFFYAAILLVKRHAATGDLLVLNHTLTFIAAVTLVLVGVLYTVQIVRYNHRHPQHPIRFLGLLPPELKEEDEGMRAFTARATRRAYIFDATALPVAAMLYVYLLPAPVFVIGGLAVVVLGHFALYLVTIWPVLGED